MSFRDHIGSCNNYDPARVVPLTAGGARIGLLRRDNAAALRRFSEVFAVGEDEVKLDRQRGGRARRRRLCREMAQRDV